MEKILKIEETTFDKGNASAWSGSYDGVIVTTDQNVYRAGIENHQDCCEDWGYLFNEDNNAQDFVGANLISVDTDGTFTRFHTDKGALEFTAYNEHNGYYSHHAVVMKNDEIIDDVYI